VSWCQNLGEGKFRGRKETEIRESIGENIEIRVGQFYARGGCKIKHGESGDGLLKRLNIRDVVHVLDFLQVPI